MGRGGCQNRIASESRCTQTQSITVRQGKRNEWPRGRGNKDLGTKTEAMEHSGFCWIRLTAPQRGVAQYGLLPTALQRGGYYVAWARCRPFCRWASQTNAPKIPIKGSLFGLLHYQCTLHEGSSGTDFPSYTNTRALGLGLALPVLNWKLVNILVWVRFRPPQAALSAKHAAGRTGNS